MRDFPFAATIVFVSLTSFMAGSALAQKSLSQSVALNNYSDPLADRLTNTPRPRVSQNSPYCGQCTDNSACGPGFVCCPMSNCDPKLPNPYGCYENACPTQQ
jgi:hypothetical protein